MFDFIKSVTIGIRVQIEGRLWLPPGCHSTMIARMNKQRSRLAEHASLETRVGRLDLNVVVGETKLEEHGRKQIISSNNGKEL